MKFKIQNFERSEIRRTKFKIFAISLFLFFVLAADGGQRTADVFADVYAPTDSIVLTVGCLDTTFLNVANADSIWFKRWRDVNGQTIVDSAKVTTFLRTGFARWKIKASDGSNNYGTYIAEATVYKQGKTGIKAWTWMVKAEFDSITNAITDANKANFKVTVVKVNGGYVGQCTTLVNEARIVSTDTVQANLIPADSSIIMMKADSSLYMRTDWANIKNQNAQVNFNQTHIGYVDTVDSINEEITASVDTSQIKTMNNNNQWGASYTWSYSTRTLTSGAGSGANSVVIRCKQSSDSSNIALAQIQVLDSTENSTIGLLTSDSQGRGFFALDNGTYCVRLYKPGWQFTVPETLKVNGNENENEDTTYYADAFNPGSPPEASLCRVYGWIYDINNQPVVGAKIEASIKTIPLRYENVIISPYYKSTTTDDEGFWYLDLYPNSVLSPYDTKYIFFIYSPSGTILRIETTVPNQSSWELQW